MRRKPTAPSPGQPPPRAWICRQIHVDKPEDVGPAWELAFAADRPTLLDVRTDPNVPPIPPHATFEQIKGAAEAMLKGDENALSVIRTGVKQKLQEFLPTVP